MLIGLLVVLGVDLVVIVILAASSRPPRWLKSQPGEFRGAIRVSDGVVPGLKPTWKRGSGRWVGNVLVW